MIPPLNSLTSSLNMLNTLGGVGSASPSSNSSSTAAGTATGSFADTFKAAIQDVDSLQAGADAKVSNLLQGAPNTDVSNVMVSVEKADVAFQLMMQVRNKIVNAYQDIEKMQF